MGIENIQALYYYDVDDSQPIVLPGISAFITEPIRD